MASVRVVSDLMLSLWEEVLWPFLDAWDSVASAHNRHAMECPREIRALWRALLLPFEERADGPQGAGSVWAQHPASFSSF